MLTRSYCQQLRMGKKLNFAENNIIGFKFSLKSKKVKETL
jgi:hypothetical protein